MFAFAVRYLALGSPIGQFQPTKRKRSIVHATDSDAAERTVKDGASPLEPRLVQSVKLLYAVS